jgi:NTE family protein
VSTPSIALALGGGGARGFAHLGVLEVLKSEGIPIDGIVGTSMGALIGATYGAHVDLHYMKDLIDEIPWKDLMDVGFRRMGLTDGQRVTALIRLLTKRKRLEDLDPRVWVVATNLLNGEEVVFTEGVLDVAVRASISIPGLFTPVTCENAFLVDGGLVAGVPVTIARRMETDAVVAVNVAHDFKRSTPTNLFEVLIQTVDIMTDRIDRYQIHQADLVITPNVGDIGTLEFNRGKECIERGAEAAWASLPALKRLLERCMEKKHQLEMVVNKSP